MITHTIVDILMKTEAYYCMIDIWINKTNDVPIFACYYFAFQFWNGPAKAISTLSPLWVIPTKQNSRFIKEPRAIIFMKITLNLSNLLSRTGSHNSVMLFWIVLLIIPLHNATTEIPWSINNSTLRIKYTHSISFSVGYYWLKFMVFSLQHLDFECEINDN